MSYGDFIEKIKSNSYYKLIDDNKLVSLGVAAVLSSAVLAYFFIPAYKAAIGSCVAVVGGAVAPALTSVSNGIAAGFVFAASHPMIFGLLAVAAVATIITLAVKNYNYSKDSETKNANEIMSTVKKTAEEAFTNLSEFFTKDEKGQWGLKSEAETGQLPQKVLPVMTMLDDIKAYNLATNVQNKGAA